VLEGSIELVIEPQGDWHVTGEVHIPDVVYITDPLVDKEIQIGPKLDITIPIINLGIASLFVNINGGLYAFAKIDRLRLEQAKFIVKYNPKKEEETSVTGFGVLALPAAVGVRATLGVKVGGRVLVFTATLNGDLSLTAEADLVARLGAGFTWAPNKGLTLGGFASLTATASLTFAVTASADVNLDLWLYTKNLWHHEFGGKKLSYKPPLALGASMPFSYTEGEGFDIDIHKIKFDEPKFDAESTFKDVFHHARKEDGNDGGDGGDDD